MIEINFSHSKINNFTDLQEKLSKIHLQKQPTFYTYKTNTNLIKNFQKKFKKYENIIVIAMGGSISSFEAIYKSLKEFNSKKKVFFVKTLDPDFILQVKKSCKKNESVAIVISKSGITNESNENFFYFKEFKTIAITTFNNNPFHKIAQNLGLELIEHPNVGGRFSGGTEVALLPAALAEIKIKAIHKGIQEGYTKYNYKIPFEQNNALKLAAVLYKLELHGFTEVFLPIYSTKLNSFNELIMQLMHESVCKQEKGQTFLCAEAPQSQHHTNQRFFGGHKNICGLFLRVKNFSTKQKINVSKQLLENSELKERLKIINNSETGKLMEFEFRGTYEDAIQNNIPVIEIALEKADEQNIGELIAFFQFLAVYSALLRDVNPFDQPQVEGSKKISFEYRKKARN